LIVNSGIESVKNGSDSATSGSYLRVKTASGDLNVWMWQLGASNTFDLWNYNAGGDNAWEKACRFTTTNLNATFYGSEITLGNGTAAQSNKLTTGDGIYASTNYDPDQYYLAWNYSNKGGTESVGVSSRASWIWKGVTSTSGNYLELRHRAGNAAAGTQNSVLKFTSSQNAEFAGNVGIGVSPSSTNTSHDSLNIGGNGYWASYGTQGAGGEMDIGHNFYYAQSGNNTYISTDEATRYRQGAGMHTFSTAASGSAGGTVTFSDVLTLNADSSATFKGADGNGNTIYISSGSDADRRTLLWGNDSSGGIGYYDYSGSPTDWKTLYIQGNPLILNNNGDTIQTGSGDFLIGGRVGIDSGGYTQQQLHVGDLGTLLLSHGTDTDGEYSGIFMRSEGGEENGMLRTKGLIAFERTGAYGVGDMKFCINGDGNNTAVTNSDVALKIDSSKNATFAGNQKITKHLGIGVDYHNDTTLQIENSDSSDYSYIIDGKHTATNANGFGVRFSTVATGAGRDILELKSGASGSEVQRHVFRSDGSAKITGALTCEGTLHVKNSSSTSSGIEVGCDAGDFKLFTFNSTHTTNGAFVSDSATVDADDNLSGGLSIMSRHASGQIRFYTGGYADGNKAMSIFNDQNIGVNGHFYPEANNTESLGFASYRWATVYGVNENFSSDQTLKKNISTSDLGMDFIKSLNPVKFNWKKSFGDDTKQKYGFLAQEIKETGLSDSVTGEEGEMGMSYNDFIAPIVKALQELSSKVEALENK